MYSGSKTPHPPTRLLHALWTSFKHLAGYEQQDAHEFLVALLYRLHEHLDDGRAFGCDCVIHKTFSGVLQSSVTCLGCGSCNPVFDPFMDIAIDVVPRDEHDQLSLETCLDRFCQVETLPGGSYVCAACNSTFKEANKQLSIRKHPNTLCIQLKRFQSSADLVSASAKLQVPVSFPNSFSIYPYLSDALTLEHERFDSENMSPKHLYMLAAVIHHIGLLDTSGHYIAYIKHREHWFRMDDATVTAVPDAEVFKCNAYMLLYNRINPL